MFPTSIILPPHRKPDPHMAENGSANIKNKKMKAEQTKCLFFIINNTSPDFTKWHSSGLIVQIFQICLPFQGKQIPLIIVALLTGGNHVSFFAFTASNQRHHMVHGQVFTTYHPPAIVAFTLLYSGIPPVGAPETPGLFFFTPDLLFMDPA
jgi:hypothetical protein